MRIYNQFFDNETLKNLLKYAKEARYTRVEDGKYNFKKASVEGVLFSETQKTFYKNNIEGNLESLRVQCIDDSINVAESFHTHNTVYITSLVCFLNDDFFGGEFEYIEDTNKLIKPSPNTALVFEPELRHRVLPVTKGSRYTLVAFISENSYLIKKDKTLL